MAADSSTSAQRRRATKPLIEKRRRARINSSLAQLKEIVAKPSSNVQETRSNRLEKADILEMTVEYVKKLHGKGKPTDNARKDNSVTSDFEQSFREGYRLCMSEVQNFFFENYQKQASKEFLSRSLQNYLQQIFHSHFTAGSEPSHAIGKDKFSGKSSRSIECGKLDEDCDMDSTRKEEVHEIHSESSDLGCSSYSSNSTDDEMVESCFASKCVQKNTLQINSGVSNKSIFQRKHSHLTVIHSVNSADKMWRPW